MTFMGPAFLRLAALGAATLAVAVLTGTGQATAALAVPAVKVPAGVPAAGLALRAPVDWDKLSDNLRTIDTDPGGRLKWDRKAGRIRICDRNKDGKIVRGYVTIDGKPAKLRVKVHQPQTKPRHENHDFVRIGGKGSCHEGKIIGYKIPKNKHPKYGFKVCLADSDLDPSGYCNTSDSNEWPQGDLKNNSCWDYDKTTQEKIDCVGGVHEYCHQWLHKSSMIPWACEEAHTPKKEKALKPPPVGRSPDIYARPDLSLPHSHPKDIGQVTAPVAYLLRWLVWTVMGSCVAGFVFVGGRMTIRHRRGEVGANATELGWVLVATLVAGSGCVIAVVQLLVDPF
jgi:hypothetical protein